MVRNYIVYKEDVTMSLPTEEQILEAVQSDDYMGFCRACGAQAYGVEPDARNYECEECGAREVYGAEEFLL